VGLLDSKEEQPHSHTLRYAVTGVALAIFIVFFIWYYYLRFLGETRAVTTFMNDIVAGKYEDAYKVWKPAPSYTFGRFMDDWGPMGYYAPIKSYQVIPPRHMTGSGTVIGVEISAEPKFPDQSDPKSGQNRIVALWIESKDLSFSFPP
jgi:hypothetical protein